MTNINKDQIERTSTKRVLRLYISASWRFKTDAILALLTPVAAILTSVAIPYYSGKALTSSLQNTSDFNSNLVSLIVVSVLAIAANRIGFIRLMHLQAKTMDYLHQTVFKRILDRGVSFHTNQIGGKLVSDALDYISAYSTLSLAIYNSGLSLIAVIFFGLLIILLSVWQLGVFLCIAVGITLFWAYIESRRRNDLRSIRLRASKRLTGHLSDSIVNAQTVKTFAGENFEAKENKRLNAVLYKLRIKDWTRAGRSGNDRTAFLVLMLILLLVLVKYLAKTDPSVVSTGIFAFTYTFVLLMRLFDINTLTRQFEESILQATPVSLLLEQEDEVKDSASATELTVSKGQVDFNKVGFTYDDDSGNKSVFQDLNLHVKSGEKVGLVGPSGGGKTTLTRLLLRFSDVQNGDISIDGQPISDVTQASLRSNVAYVPQEPLLFHRTIKENIAYGDPSASITKVEEAAKLAYAHEFIKGLPNGYDTIVGERGVKLSGGQRQRVAIARAILKNSPILVFDEATSALDSESEALIQKALRELMEKKTTIVIAHRLSTIQKMDRIIVLKDGKIAEQGTHKALLEQSGTYAELWKHQSGGFLEE